MKTPASESFADYGVLLKDDFSDVVSYLETKTPIPETGNIYVASDEEFAKLPSAKALAARYFVNAMQAGYCNGQNEKLNCLEYHGCPEVDIAADDLVLLLARQKDIVDNSIDSGKVVPFLLKKGQGVMLYPGTLHFSPCRQSLKGFRSAVFLAVGTNLPLDKPSPDPRYFKTNKWLYAHPEAKQASLGAYVGISGENITIKCQ
jgi:hypothetical protein